MYHISYMIMEGKLLLFARHKLMHNTVQTKYVIDIYFKSWCIQQTRDIEPIFDQHWSNIGSMSPVFWDGIYRMTYVWLENMVIKSPGWQV